MPNCIVVVQFDLPKRSEELEASLSGEHQVEQDQIGNGDARRPSRRAT